jgi:NAD(P)H-flavin reductase
MEFAKAEKCTTRLSEKYFLNENESYMIVKLELVEPDRMEFLAGQYVSIKVNELGERRSYSIASTPDVNHGVILVAEMIPGGKGSEYIKSLKPGDTVEILGPLGRFVVEPANQHKLLFVATGSGIAPINSMINNLLINKQETRPMRLQWGMRDEEHMFWFDNYETGRRTPNFVFDRFCLNQEQTGNYVQGM